LARRLLTLLMKVATVAGAIEPKINEADFEGDKGLNRVTADVQSRPNSPCRVRGFVRARLTVPVLASVKTPT
jgi:hypothetical protein